MTKTLAAALLLSSALTAPAFAESLTRVVTVPVGAEITGMFDRGGSDLFFNVQHPSDDIGNEFAKAAVGVIANVNYDAEELAVSHRGGDDKILVKSTLGDYQVLVQEGS